MHFLLPISSTALLLSLTAFLPSTSAAPQWNKDHFYPPWYVPDTVKPGQLLCKRCTTEIQACVNNYTLTLTADPSIKITEYYDNCQCQTVETNRYCREICGRTCEQGDYEGPYMSGRERCEGCFEYEWKA